MAQPEKVKYVREKASVTFFVPPPVARFSRFPWHIDMPIQEAMELSAQLTDVLDKYAEWLRNQKKSGR